MKNYNPSETFTSPNGMIYQENPRSTMVLRELYEWFNHDNGSIVLDESSHKWWIEKTWTGAKYPNQKLHKKISQMMKKYYSATYLYI